MPDIDLNTQDSKASVTTTHVTKGLDGIEHRKRSNGSDPSDGPVLTNDELTLAQFGKKQLLKRRFKSISTVGLTCGLMLSWISVTGALQFGLLNGGPAGMIWGFLGAIIGAMLQALVMAEIASMIPLAGGAFNWVAILSPPSCRKLLSYIAGWLTVMTYQIYLLSVCYGSATTIRGLVILTHPDYVPKLWHSVLMSYGVAGLGLFVNTYLGRVLPHVESFLLVFVVLGYFSILIPLVYLSPHREASDVFGTFINLGGWSSDGIAFFVGWTGAVGSFIGADGADHIAEEIESAAKVIPFSMWFSTLLNGALAFGMLIAVLFAAQDYVGAATSDTGWAIIEIYHQGLGSTQGAVALVSIGLAINILSVSSLMATASRALWAFARENGLPFSSFIAKVDRETRLPYNAIFVSIAIEMVLALIGIGSNVAFQAFISVGVAVYYSTFLVAACVMLHKRLTTPESQINWGPFRLYSFGTPITIISILYTVVAVFFSFFPLGLPVTAENMNYSCLIFGAAFLLMLGFWVAHGRGVYTGPIWELDGDGMRGDHARGIHGRKR